MAFYRHQVITPVATGLPEDAIVNVWHTKTGVAASETDAEAITDALLDFHNAIQGLAPTGVLDLSAGAGRVKAYEVNPGSPGAADDTSVLLDETTWTVGAVAAPANLAMPTEVAVCMSMVATGASSVPEETGTIRPRSRYRGRVYLGPWCTSPTTVAIVAGAPRVASGLRTVILNYGDALGTALNAAGASLCVYSRSDAAFKTVETLQVDDEWDTVRSRGHKRTLRETRSI